MFKPIVLQLWPPSTAVEIWKTCSIIATDVTHLTILGACASLGTPEALEIGRHIHQQLSGDTLKNNLTVGHYC